MLNVCGASCDSCPESGKQCLSTCADLQGRVFWTKFYNFDVCPFFACVEQKQLDNCGSCPDLPCKIWQDLKDPNLSEEQHQKSINDRISRLKQA